jgi:hypothetical protein
MSASLLVAVEGGRRVLEMPGAGLVAAVVVGAAIALALASRAGKLRGERGLVVAKVAVAVLAIASIALPGPLMFVALMVVLVCAVTMAATLRRNGPGSHDADA